MKALHNITYGLFILTAKTNKYNGCIINTLQQVTSNPTRIIVTVNKDNFTTKMIEKTGEFNISILDMTTSFDIIKHFGFSSGENIDKFEDFSDYKLAKNQIPYITKHTNSYISAKVISKTDLGTHYLFVADITEDVVLSTNEPVTYAYYLSNIKQKFETKKSRVFICKVCGYIYDGESLPEDYTCPICKHGIDDFILQEQSISYQKQYTDKSIKSNKSQKYYCPICGNIEESESDKCVICGAQMIKFEI